jgi:hypothetical protein
MSSRGDFTTISTEGGLLPPGLLKRLREPNNGLPATDAAAYHVTPPRRLSEAISEAWNTLQGAWTAYREARDRLPDSATGTTLTRERWLQPLFQTLGYGRLLTRTAITIDGVTYPISHGWHHVPIHLVSFRIDLDTRTAGVIGAARTSPHSLVQGYLNATSDSLWGIVTNGHRLRLLRDHHALTRQSYVEYDLEAMLDGEVYADFVLLYLTLHQSRLEADNPNETILEKWATEARDSGTRALDRLRDGVHRALQSLGQGFLDHPNNTHLRQRLRGGDLDAQDYYRQLLRLVYRFLILFAAEDRDLLHPPDTSDAARHRYEHYGTRRLRNVADTVRGGKHPDRYEAFKHLTSWLSGDGAPALGLPALGGFLFSPNATPDLDSSVLSNRAFLRAIRALAFTDADGARLPVDYRNLGAEELGSVYESLLELHPIFEGDRFDLATAAGNERKTTGSYYTPTSLITLLLDSALTPVLETAAAADDPEQAILDLKIVDPASGSGHFLIAAAHRVARHLAQVRTGDDEPAIAATRSALRDVISRCLYAVDVNPMATELCKVALWLEALDPGRPLTFLDHRIKSGNSLIGAAPHISTNVLVKEGIPDDAYKPIEGDTPAAARSARDRNRQERRGQRSLFSEANVTSTADLARAVRAIDAVHDDDINAVRAKEHAHSGHLASEAYRRARVVADSWVAAFLWPKHAGTPKAITSGDVHDLSDGRTLSPERLEVLDRVLAEFRPFHWRIEFPDAFLDNRDGFDVVLGNPPWDQIQLDPREYFAQSRPDIRDAKNMAARNRLINRLVDEDPALHQGFMAATRAVSATQHFLHSSGHFPRTTRGRLNLAPLFAELCLRLIGTRGRAGFIVPSGIATDSFTQHYFRTITEEKNLVSLYDFENRLAIFPGVHRSYKFALVTLTGSERPADEVVFVFFAHDTADIFDQQRRFTLTANEIALLNPNTRTAPTFRSRTDAEVTKGIYRRVPVLANDASGSNPWGVRFKLMFMMNSDSVHFRTHNDLEAHGFALRGNTFVRDDETLLPLYEGRMIHQYNHRFGTYEGTDIRDTRLEEHEDPAFEPHPRYWLTETLVDERLSSGSAHGSGAVNWTSPWLVCYREIARSTDVRTVICSLIPRAAVGHKAPLMLVSGGLEHALLLVGAMNSLALDYCARQSVGGTSLSQFVVRQLPVPKPDAFSPADIAFVVPRVLELTATSHRMAQGLGLSRAFRWDPERRFQMQCELDAFFFHQYGLSKPEVIHILGQFPIIERRDNDRHGHFRTRDTVLGIFDQMTNSHRAGRPYETSIVPPPSLER